MRGRMELHPDMDSSRPSNKSNLLFRRRNHQVLRRRCRRCRLSSSTKEVIHSNNSSLLDTQLKSHSNNNNHTTLPQRLRPRHPSPPTFHLPPSPLRPQAPIQLIPQLLPNNRHQPESSLPTSNTPHTSHPLLAARASHRTCLQTRTPCRECISPLPRICLPGSTLLMHRYRVGRSGGIRQ